MAAKICENPGRHVKSFMGGLGIQAGSVLAL